MPPDLIWPDLAALVLINPRFTFFRSIMSYPVVDATDLNAVATSSMS